jgi:photosystem II stability/assembly factor-like uncharacterized protein
LKLVASLLAIAAVVGAPVCGSTERGTDSVALLRDGTAHQALFSIAFAGNAGIAVGAAGAIVETEDGGRHWAPPATPVTKLALLGVDMHGSERLAVGQQGLVLIKQGQKPWMVTASGTDNRLLGVSFNSQGLAIAVGAFGTIIKSTDGGRTWQLLRVNWDEFVEPGTEPHLYAAHVDDSGVITLAGEFGLILRSIDGGDHWQLVHKGDASLLALELRDDGIGYAVGQNGSIVRTADHGLTWTTLNAGTKAILLGVSSGPAGRVYVTAMRDMLASDDDGATWRHVAGEDLAVAWYAAIARSSVDGGAIAVGHAGRVLGFGM